jgi:DNA integrity scanning protein DisA with diadenylate cyclase activity
MIMASEKLTEKNELKKLPQTDQELARMVIAVAQAARAGCVICLTETGELARQLLKLGTDIRIIATTTNTATYTSLTEAGVEVFRLPVRAAEKHNQIRHAISVVLKSTKISVGDFLVCAIGREVYPESGRLVVLTEVEPDIEELAISDLLKLTDGIRPTVLEIALAVACKIGRAARRGKRLGTIITLGDSLKVLENSRQLVPNPFQGHDDATRQLTNPAIHDSIVELAKLDGAFVVRGDGFIQTAGAFLAAGGADIEIPAGLGTRHAVAAAVTRRTASTAIVVSATDGTVRAFSGGQIILHIDPELAHHLYVG